MGVTIGVYAYFAGFSSMDREISESIKEYDGTLVIIGEAYGGCEQSVSCPSFQVANDGRYRYFYVPRGADAQVLREGNIPKDLHEQLKAVLRAGELQVASRPIEPAYCNSFDDGIDVAYRVTVDDVDFNLDSCGTDVDGDGQLWQTLGKIWNYFESIG